MSLLPKYRFLFAGGGTGGHLFPALAVAEQIMQKINDAKIVFIGRKDKLESRIVPKHGFEFHSIIIQGFVRKKILENIIVAVKFLIGFVQSLLICFRLKPQVVIATGGYISAPAALAAKFMGAKMLLIEPNSYPGITTRLLEKQADEIHLAFPETKKFLRYKEKLYVTGNPVRSSLQLIDRSSAVSSFKMNEEYPVLLVTGGSLGAKAFNNFIVLHIEEFRKKNIQVIWQTGANGFEANLKYSGNGIFVTPFIDEMQIAFSAADLVMSRSGATVVAEISSLGIAAILIPSPNVTENHQYYNAKSLENIDAAILVEEKDMNEKLFQIIFTTIYDKSKLLSLKENAKKFSNPKTSAIISERVINLADSISFFPERN